MSAMSMENSFPKASIPHSSLVDEQDWLLGSRLQLPALKIAGTLTGINSPQRTLNSQRKSSLQIPAVIPRRTRDLSSAAVSEDEAFRERQGVAL